MTVTNTTRRYQYTGNGVTTDFAFPSLFFVPEDLVVTLTNPLTGSGPPTHLNGADTYGYVVLGNPDPVTGEYLSGATVTFNTAPQSGFLVTIFREVPLTQPVSFFQNDPLPAPVLNTALDRGILIAQDMDDDLRLRALVAPVTDPPPPSNPSMVLPTVAQRANRFLMFDGTGQPVASTFSPPPISTNPPVNIAAGAVGDGVHDDTTTLQANIDGAFAAGAPMILGSGNFRITAPLAIYSGQRLEFALGAILWPTGCLFGIRTMLAPGTPGQSAVTTLIRPQINMNGANGAAIWWESVLNGIIDQPVNRGALGSGSFNYDDGSGFGSASYESCYIAIKGSAATGGGHYTLVVQPDLVGTGVGIGIWVGTTKGQLTHRANITHIAGGRCFGFNMGIKVYTGGDFVADHTDCSSSTFAGFQLGVDGLPVNRGILIRPYIEDCGTYGVHFGPGCFEMALQGTASNSGTPTPVYDQGDSTSISSNFPTGAYLGSHFIFTSETFTVARQTGLIDVMMGGAGGAGGGAIASAIAAGGSIGGGGGGGATARFIVDVADFPISPAVITIGAGGVGATGLAGGVGGATSFVVAGGPNVVCPGGPGGQVSGGGANSLGAGGTGGADPTIANVSVTLVNEAGPHGHAGLNIGGLGFSGRGVDMPGGGTLIGRGGAPLVFAGGSVQSPGNPAGNRGAGGAGAASVNNVAGTAQAGGNGGNGWCIIFEYAKGYGTF